MLACWLLLRMTLAVAGWIAYLGARGRDDLGVRLEGGWLGGVVRGRDGAGAPEGAAGGVTILQNHGSAVAGGGVSEQPCDTPAHLVVGIRQRVLVGGADVEAGHRIRDADAGDGRAAPRYELARVTDDDVAGDIEVHLDAVGGAVSGGDVEGDVVGLRSGRGRWK